VFGFRPSGDPALAAALNPTAIAIIGASDNPHKIGGRPLHYLSRFGMPAVSIPSTRIVTK
jgi:hypothetical protein